MKEKKEMQIVVTADDSKAKSKLENLASFLKNNFRKEETQEVRLSTKEAKAKIEDLKKEVAELKTFADSLTSAELSSGFYNRQLQELSSKQNNLNKLQDALQETNKETIEIGHNFDNLGKNLTTSFDNASRKAKRFVLSLFSLRTIWALLSRASSTYLSQNETTANKVEAVWVYLGNLLAPIIERIVSWLQYGIAYLNVFTKALLGVDILAKAINNSVKTTAKEMKKTLSSMDEIVNLQQDSGNANNGMGVANALEDINNLELNPKIVKFLEDLANKIKKVWDLAKELWIFLSDNFGPAGAALILGGLGLLLGSRGFGGLATILGSSFVISFVYGAITGRDLLDDITNIIKGFNDLRDIEEEIKRKTQETIDIARNSTNTLVQNLNNGSLSVQQINNYLDMLKVRLDDIAENPAMEENNELLKVYAENLKILKNYYEENLKVLDKNTAEYKEQESALKKIDDRIKQLDGTKAEVEVELRGNNTGFFNGLKNGISTALSSLGNAFGGVFKSLRGYATGGFPNEGQMFYANERGPELVGTIGGSTAVVNNTQIVDAVSLGVANAVSSVLGSQKNSSSNATYLYINGSEFAKAVYDDMETENQRRNKNTSIRRS